MAQKIVGDQSGQVDPARSAMQTPLISLKDGTLVILIASHCESVEVKRYSVAHF